MRTLKPYMTLQTLKAIYYAHFHYIISYGIIFWGHTSPSMRVFRMQKRIVRIMMGSRARDSCRKLFTKLEILPLPSLYIFFLLRYVILNKGIFLTNNETHTHNTGQCTDFHYPMVNLKKLQTGVHYMGVKLFNGLPPYIKSKIGNTKRFELLLKKYLLQNTFYSLEEFYNHE